MKNRYKEWKNSEPDQNQIYRKSTMEILQQSDLNSIT